MDVEQDLQKEGARAKGQRSEKGPSLNASGSQQFEAGIWMACSGLDTFNKNFGLYVEAATHVLVWLSATINRSLAGIMKSPFITLSTTVCTSPLVHLLGRQSTHDLPSLCHHVGEENV